MVVVTQKIVSKAEGRVADLRWRLSYASRSNPHQAAGVAEGDDLGHRRARDFALTWEKDARAVEIILREAVRVVRMEGGVLITETRHGFVCANSGVDASNVGRGGDYVVLLPLDPDASARRIRDTLREDVTGADVAVIVSDTFGRPWREGALNVAIGCAGIEPLLDYRGDVDSDGRELRSTVIAVADELAAASELVMHKLHRVPVAVVRGYPYEKGDSGIRPVIREPGKDLFR